MKKLPVGVQTFSEMIGENYLYVDKTKYIYNLFADGGKYYFLSRPRRFGKSLLLSTLKEIFSGNQTLFEGLWIYDKIEWKKYPVIYIDFLKIGCKTPGILEKSLEKIVRKMAGTFNIVLDKEGDYKDVFRDLIEGLGKKNKVAILIDEYDKPIIDFVDDKEVAKKNRDILRNFYTTIKGMDEYIKFAFLTGVSKFSKVSVFSGLNNLRDITLSQQFTTMLGYTEEELLNYFNNRVEKLVPGLKREKPEILDDIKRWYNGYSWDGENFVYNPLSILSFFQESKFSNYWFSTGTPTFLIKFIKEKAINVETIGAWEVDESVFDSYDIENMDVASLLFQTGYITVKGIKTLKDIRKYYLSYPNQEVKDAFLKYLLADFIASSPATLGSKIFDLTEQLIDNRLDLFFVTIKSLFASIPYNIFIHDREAYYHSVIYLILTLLGINIKAEVQTNTGRIDALIEINDRVYIMEFKMGSEKDALKQIKDRQYYDSYKGQAKNILLVGVGFDMGKRNISGYILEDYDTTK
ncbi:MAG: ATP-binding protein [Candidatus Aminicenantes bacterium]|nr:ATP-binding protein [Candidatus Aminicenantes bacterium]